MHQTEAPERLYSKVNQIQKTTSDIDFAVTALYTYRLLEETNEENASTTTSPSAADTRDGGNNKKQHSNRLAENFE